MKFDLVYVDTSVVLAQLLSEDVRPPSGFWNLTLVSSRLIQYETWTRLHAMNLDKSHGQATQTILGRISMLELTPIVLSRALEPFPVVLRTLDALHVASLCYLQSHKIRVVLAAYDDKLMQVAGAMKLALAEGFGKRR